MPITKATHVLSWFPPGHLDPAPIWQLRVNTESGTVIQQWSCSDADEDPGKLLGWVADALNDPVHLGHRQEKRIKGRLFGRVVVPFYYVFPGWR